MSDTKEQKHLYQFLIAIMSFVTVLALIFAFWVYQQSKHATAEIMNQLASSKEAYSNEVLKYRYNFQQDCEKEKEGHIQKAEDFLNKCTISNSLESCQQSEAFQFILTGTTKDFVPNCITKKMETLGISEN